MSEDIDEARSWPEGPLDADELQQLLEAIKAALDAHDDPRWTGGRLRLAGGDGARA